MALAAMSAGLPPSLLLWPQLALTHVEEELSSENRPARLVVVGPAGSDKSPLLDEISRRVSHVEDTLFVDDAHLLTDDQIRVLDRHLDDPGAGLVVSCRPWPWTPALTALIRRIEQSRPALAVGQVDTEDVVRAVEQAGRSIDPGCIGAIVRMAASVTWLVKQALAAHGDGYCRDPSHERVIRAVGEVIALRLDTLEPPVAAVVRRASLGGDEDLPAATDDAVAAALAVGHAEGLLLRGGRPVPIVRTTVTRTTPVAQLIDLLDTSSIPSLDAEVASSLGGHVDARLARVLQAHADQAATYDFARATELYDAALAAGADPNRIALRKARMAWDRGDIDEAASLVDAVALSAEGDDHSEALRILGSAWSARGFLRASAMTYRAQPGHDFLLYAHGALASFGIGDPGPLLDAVERLNAGTGGVPTTLRVAHAKLMRGLAASLTWPAGGAFDELIRASETYGDSGERGPVPELPAVIAAIGAINLGELQTAANILGDALMDDHGGPWARSRLLLWAAWVAVHRQHPEESAARLADVDASFLPLSSREILVRDAVMLAHVRRYGSLDELRALWMRVRDDVRHVEPDLFLLHPLREFIETAPVFDDSERVAPALETLTGILHGLGDPLMWSVPLTWSSFQRAMLARDPHGQAQTVRTLSAVARGSRLAGALSAAATEWSRNRVDEGAAERIEEVASRMAEMGLGWEGARLAVTLSERSRDRRTGIRLAAFARTLHPSAAPGSATNDVALGDSGLLSAREREVAGLVLRGMTYAEIGEAIFISPRTAEHHIARIRRRIGATSRTDLIAKLQAIVGAEDGGTDNTEGR
ncbi:helix-turn-helix transcriptional regulator [Microbacterium aquilitoris]|uniref:Helix-turn-helix transcriptional regulator n=1 Tax=Microbacterium aquilitoris TaxID=3067307 RepID=A0ABU3GHA9_9MICO|nr:MULTISPECIES: helix-turn-helix transcriptional regulator [unclassified Microbacterium]MDT3329745.1 helix-turn-helix transcriptional regulator [Microbacterium sp. KSW-18]MDT3345579.1 helix-turn-helix transcriptional regulator [Microbacterium sp. KSW2-22]